MCDYMYLLDTKPLMVSWFIFILFQVYKVETVIDHTNNKVQWLFKYIWASLGIIRTIS